MSHAHAPTGEPCAEPISLEAFKAEVRTWAERIGVEPAEIHVRAMKRKWASCSSAGRLTFHTGLLTEAPTFRNEVVVHELLHLKVSNHGPLFRSLLRAYLAAGSIASFPDGESVDQEMEVSGAVRMAAGKALSPGTHDKA